jgi:hypothetical protein
MIWDNRAIQHARAEIASVSPRTLQRTSFGELGYWQQVPTSQPDYQQAKGIEPWRGPHSFGSDGRALQTVGDAE